MLVKKHKFYALVKSDSREIIDKEGTKHNCQKN